MARRMTSRQKKTVKMYRNFGIVAFIAVLLLFAVLGLLIPIRPTESEVENRTLTKFPSFTMAEFLDGSYFSGVSTWYSDTFPLRDGLITLNQKVKGLYGIKGSVQVVGADVEGDEIPDVPAAPSDDNDDPEAPAAQTQESEEAASEEAAESGANESAAEVAPEEENAASAVDTAELQEQAGQGEAVTPDAYKMEQEVQNQIQKRLFVKDGAAYTIFSFSRKAADAYIEAMSNVAAKLKGKTNVYSILVPLNSGAVLDDATLKSLGGSDQIQTIDYYYNSYKGVQSVDTIRTLRAHPGEYLFFRTDHHWTALGAYYVYRNFCQMKGWTPNELDSYETKEFTPFLGTYYTKLDKPADMANNPDVVTAYIPHGTNEMEFTDKANKTTKWNVIRDVSSRGAGAKYGTFIAGDQPMGIIENPNVTDGSSCLVLKESYGNCFVPFLVDHYSKIYIVDFRYAKVNVADYIQKNNINDLIVVNNIGIINSEKVVKSINSLF